MPSTNFLNFWETDLTRQCLLSHIKHDDLKALRLVCQDFAFDVAPVLFATIDLHFTANSFGRQARLLALERIGHHVKTFNFIMLHTADTFLPPLIAPDTVEEINFVYEPRPFDSRPASASSSSSSSKYGSWEMSDLLIKHYPPLFHAASNIQAFARAMAAIPDLRELRISCPGQASGQRYRRDIVDYALISLRVAVEQANPCSLHTLILDEVHPAAVLYLRPQVSYGASPASTRVWRRVKKLDIAMNSFAYGRDTPSDHLKALHTYLQSFAALEHLNFRWLGSKGPCPLSLDAEPCTSRPASLDCAQACPKSCALPSCRPIKFRYLRTMRLANATLDSSQAAAFISLHRKVLHEFEFDECHLRSGTWDDALAPLSRITGNNGWKKGQEEVMDVPLVLSAVQERDVVERVHSKLWDDPTLRRKGYEALKKMSLRTKDMIPGHFRRLLRGARVGWH
jgi:hypothetical protein